eukprot:CAMPEP_0172485392 /NCGR_PEP_ID=MMETSP1066-20121228/13461_1 /TAXON_ID=671091 /ORGANISM="Coscinodiscus wailesii, Strain CCMP2513" /LENGTH=83 /DNA_ID=CAMNT_0013250661 /DNA_START=698 /DNA_END=949 /DNA_ORIENTATION=-
MTFNPFDLGGVIYLARVKNADSFRFELFLHGEDNVRYIFILKFFVGVVDTKLLEAVCFEYFKAKDVQQANRTMVFSSCCVSNL